MDRRIWKDIPEFIGKYQASDTGEIKSLIRKCTVRKETFRKRNGKRTYAIVTLSGKSRTVHSLVCSAFWGPKPRPKYEVNHINGIKSDNRPENLEWVNKTENMRHRFAREKARKNMPPSERDIEESEQYDHPGIFLAGCKHKQNQVFKLLKQDDESLLARLEYLLNQSEHLLEGQRLQAAQFCSTEV